MNQGYLPIKVKILNIEKHTDIDYTYRVGYTGAVKPGQFFEISIPKVGEAPISVSEIGVDYLDFTIRRVGCVSNEIHNLTLGDAFYIRGPYGNGFDIDLYINKETIVAAGGTGLAPVKGVIDYFAVNPQDSKGFTLVMGFKTPKDMLFIKDIKTWEKKIKTILTVASASGEYQGNTGLITNYIKDLEIKDVDNAQVIVVGPPIMMKFTVLEFLKRGIIDENIWVSYERRMSCGVGKCGHCRIDDTYICVDGPVFNFTKARYLID